MQNAEWKDDAPGGHVDLVHGLARPRQRGLRATWIELEESFQGMYEI